MNKRVVGKDPLDLVPYTSLPLLSHNLLYQKIQNLDKLLISLGKDAQGYLAYSQALKKLCPHEVWLTIQKGLYVNGNRFNPGPRDFEAAGADSEGLREFAPE